MELDAPGGLAEPERLRTDPAPGQLHAAGRHGEGVEVPLEGREARREIAEHRVVRGVRGELDLDPADLGARRRCHRRAGRLSEELCPETDAEQRRSRVEQALDQHPLVCEPGVSQLLVGMHRAAEEHDRAVLVDRPRRRGLGGDAPGVEPVSPLRHHLAERSRRPVLTVDDREDVHTPKSSCASAAGSRPPAAGRPASSSRPRMILRAARREVVAVVVEERVDLLGLAREPAERLDPLGELGLRVQVVEALGRALRVADVPRAPVAPVEADVGERVRGGGDRRDDVRRAWWAGSRRETNARPCRSRKRSVSASSSSVTQRAVAELDQRHERLEQRRAPAPARRAPRATS